MAGKTKLDRSGDKQRAFLDDLRELTIKHGMVVSGCGCCGSPDATAQVVKPEGFYVMNGSYAGEIAWIEPGDDYWKEHHAAKPEVEAVERSARACKICGKSEAVIIAQTYDDGSVRCWCSYCDQGFESE